MGEVFVPAREGRPYGFRVENRKYTTRDIVGAQGVLRFAAALPLSPDQRQGVHEAISGEYSAVQPLLQKGGVISIGGEVVSADFASAGIDVMLQSRARRELVVSGQYSQLSPRVRVLSELKQISSTKGFLIVGDNFASQLGYTRAQRTTPGIGLRALRPDGSVAHINSLVKTLIARMRAAFIREGVFNIDQSLHVEFTINQLLLGFAVEVGKGEIKRETNEEVIDKQPIPLSDALAETLRREIQ